MENNNVVEKIMQDFKAEKCGVYKNFRTEERDISYGGEEAWGFFIVHIPTGAEKLLAYEEPCGYQLWESSVKSFVDSH